MRSPLGVGLIPVLCHAVLAQASDAAPQVDTEEVERYKAEAKKWKDKCADLADEVDDLNDEIDELENGPGASDAAPTATSEPDPELLKEM